MPTGSPVQSVLFPAPGWDRDVYLTTFTTLDPRATRRLTVRGVRARGPAAATLGEDPDGRAAPEAVRCPVMVRPGTPTRGELLGWIEEIVGHGIRRPGYAADRSGRARRLADPLRAAARARRRPASSPSSAPRWQPRVGELQRSSAPASTSPASPSPTPARAPSRLHSAAGGRTADEPVDGRLAVEEPRRRGSPSRRPRHWRPRSTHPTGSRDDLVQVLPFGPAFQEVLAPAIASGAAGFVGLLTGFPWETCDYYVPYDGLDRPIPGLWLSGRDGRRLLGLLEGRRAASSPSSRRPSG
ncbi:MAG: hypothetical protein U5R31_17895 [Acidimicrobiia bacterium]|nr:hypothetical protein [Acidimicrobiia bacterium]